MPSSNVAAEMLGPAPADIGREALRPPRCRFASATSSLRGRSGFASRAAYRVGNAVEDRGAMLLQAFEHRGRRRPLRHQHRGRAHCQRKRQRVAQPVGEEQLGRREHDVAFTNAQDRPGIEFRSLDQAGMNVHRALRRAGRARRIEPEAGVVAGRRRGLELRCRLSPSAIAGARAHADPCRTRRHVLRKGRLFSSGSNFGSSASDTINACARLSSSMNL